MWQALSAAVGNVLLLPPPLTVVKRICELVQTAAFWQTVGMSVLRIGVGIAAALVLGTVLAVLCTRFSAVNALISPLLGIMKSTPVASFIVLLLLWTDRNVIPAVITVLIALPVVFANICGGIRAVNAELLQMVRAYRLPFGRRLAFLYVPSVFPYFISACRSGLGLAWKAGVAAEVLALPALSLGKQIYESKMFLETVDLFAWSAVVIILSVIIENALCTVLERAGNRHKRTVNVHET